MRFIKDNINKYWNIEFPLLIWLVHLAIIVFFIPGQPLKDERVFWDAAISFKDISKVFTLEFLKTYNSPQTPLSFYLAGFLLNLNNSITLLRISNSVIILLTLVVFFSTIKELLPGNIKAGILIVSVFLLNPYIHFVSILFYTDALYLLFVVLILYSYVKRKKDVVFYLSMFCAPLVRQFGIIFASGSALDEIRRKYPFINKNFILSILCLSGVGFFVILWQGSMPVNSFKSDMFRVRNVYGEIYPYIPAYHLSALGFYMSPIFIYMGRKIFSQRIFIAGGVAGAIFYILCPARQNYSNAILQPYMTTLGFYHKIMLTVLHDPYFHVILLIFAFLAGGWILYITRSSKIPQIFKLWIILFFLMSFFNLQAWDKYLLDIQAVMLITLAYLIKPSDKK